MTGAQILQELTDIVATGARDAIAYQETFTATADPDGFQTLDGVTHRVRIWSRQVDGTRVWRGLCTCRRGIEAGSWAATLQVLVLHLTEAAGLCPVCGEPAETTQTRALCELVPTTISCHVCEGDHQ